MCTAKQKYDELKQTYKDKILQKEPIEALERTKRINTHIGIKGVEALITCGGPNVKIDVQINGAFVLKVAWGFSQEKGVILHDEDLANLYLNRHTKLFPTAEEKHDF